MTERQAVYTTGPRFFAEGGKAIVFLSHRLGM